MCKFNVVLTIAAVLFAASTAQAELLLSDSFNGTDGSGINVGLAARQGGSLSTVSYLSHDDSYGVPIAIQGNVLEYSGRTDQFAPDHDFVDAAITSGGGFVVEYDTNPIVGGDGTNGYWAAFNIGLTAAQAASSVRFEGDVETDWSIQLRGDGQYVTMSNGVIVQPLTTFDSNPAVDKTYHVKVQVDTNSFASGQALTVSAWVDGAQLDLNSGAGGLDFSSTWDAGGANYMGFCSCISRNYTDKHTLDNLSIRTIPEPSTVALLVTGLIGLLAYAWRKQK